MVEANEAAREVLRGLDGLVMLAEWQLSLAKDLREKASRLVVEDGKGSPEDPLLGRPE
jgi:hypothetical protein